LHQRADTVPHLNYQMPLDVRRNLNIQPTLTIRPGFPVRVIVNRDLVLEPYRG
jgi:type IV secretion system protein TrbI